MSRSGTSSLVVASSQNVGPTIAPIIAAYVVAFCALGVEGESLVVQKLRESGRDESGRETGEMDTRLRLRRVRSSRKGSIIS